MRERVEITGEICVDNLSMAGVDQLVDVSDCVQCAAACPIGVLLGLQVGLENWFENQHCRHFRDSIFDHGNSERTLTASAELVDHHPAYRLRLISSTFQLLRQFTQPSLHSVRLDVLELLEVYARCSIIGFAAVVGVCQYVLFGTSCRTASRSDSWAIPSLLRVTPSATSERLLGLLGSSPIPPSSLLLAFAFN